MTAKKPTASSAQNPTATPFEAVAGRYDGPALEEAMLAFWDEHAIFAQSLQQSIGRPRFSFNEGPPTANGKPGIHHVLARAFKDIYPRYKTMRGYYAPRRGGWDTHGLPVEHEIEKKLEIYDKQTIEREIGVAEFNRMCRDSVMTYIGEWEAMTRRMGYWVNLDDAYYTLDNRYIESVWNLLRRIWDKGLIYQGYKVVPYDPRIGATLSSHEVSLGYREVEDPSITVRFQATEAPDTAFLAWTTTPWTLPSNLLLAVGADIEYCYVAVRGETFILAAARVADYFAEQPHAVTKTVRGAALVGQTYHRLFDELEVPPKTMAWRVVAADFVSTEDGTGIVHVAPAYGIDDLALGQREGLPVIHAVGLDGCFKAEVTPVAGLFFKDADAVLCELLHTRGLLFRHERVLHNYPFGWRTGDPLLYYAKEAWFIRTTQIKDRLVALNQTINWVPATIGVGRFGHWLENNIDWALSRERFWGTPLPLWSDGAGDFVCIGSLAELEALSGQSLTDIDLHRPQIDAITFTRDGKKYTRVPEVIDCWFDSGAMSYAQWHYPFENEANFAAHFPADYICEAIDQTRGWFYTLHAIAALVDDSVAYKNCVCLSHIVDADGKKMSKSLGNIVNPDDVFDHVGVDALRWLFLARTAPDAQKRISVALVKEVAATFINMLWNTYAFFILYARLDQVDLTRTIPVDRRPEIDRWLLALTHSTIDRATVALDQYDAHSAGQAIETLVDQLSNWYVRRNRRRFWKSEAGDDKQSAYLTLYHCLEVLQKLLAPFMPFLSEHIYQNLARADADAVQSVHLAIWPKVEPSYLDADLVAEMAVVQTVVGLGRAVREDSKVRVRQPLSELLMCPPDAAATAAIEKHRQIILDELNIKQLQIISTDTDLLRYTIKPNFARLGRRYGKLMPSIKQALAAADGRAIAEQLQQRELCMLTVGKQVIELATEDVQVVTTAADGYAARGGHGYLAALNTTLTLELRREGVARELVRTVQDARKSAGLQIADRIVLGIDGSEAVMHALETHRDYIMRETLATTVHTELGDGFTVDRTLDAHHWRITLKKA